MKKSIAKVFVPVLLIAGSTGMGLAGTTFASAASAPAKAAPKLTGVIAKIEASKDVFWIKVGAKTYRVDYSKATKFTKGTAATLAKGKSVSVTGKYVGKSTTVVNALGIVA
ncbi:MAG: hypothetical protein ACYC19_06870 [Acidimicrobiales bacterium]